jgi:hypothetical protein
MSSYPGYSVTYLAGTTDGSSLAMACAQGFATFAGVDLSNTGLAYVMRPPLTAPKCLCVQCIQVVFA